MSQANMIWAGDVVGTKKILSLLKSERGEITSAFLGAARFGTGFVGEVI